jgi:hypothetical protein
MLLLKLFLALNLETYYFIIKNYYFLLNSFLSLRDNLHSKISRIRENIILL